MLIVLFAACRQRASMQTTFCRKSDAKLSQRGSEIKRISKMEKPFQN